MVLLLQLNGELEGRFPGHERRLYIFACRRKACRRKEGWARAIRGVRIHSSDAPPQVGKEAAAAAPAASPPAPVQQGKDPVAPATLGLGTVLFGGSATVSGASAPANPFSGAAANPFAPPPSAAAVPANPFSKPAPGPDPPEAALAAQDLPRSFAATLSLDNPQQAAALGPPPPPEPWPAEAARPEPFPVSWLADAEYEMLEPAVPAPRVSKTVNVDAEEGGGGGGKEDKEVFESSMDAAFQRFADRVGQNPQQCIRYEIEGQPLLYSRDDAVGRLLHQPGAGGVGVKVATGTGFPRCGNCGARRIFEVQLMPNAIEELEQGEAGLDGMDWGTIIMAVCERDCQERGAEPKQAGYVEEWVGVQWEELTMKR